jgi:hypothetical protein
MSGAKQNIKTLDLDADYLEEIISILAQHGRPDLIGILRQSRDDDYKPPQKKIKEYYEYYEGYETQDEKYDQSDVSIDSNGFWSLK